MVVPKKVMKTSISPVVVALLVSLASCNEERAVYAAAQSIQLASPVAQIDSLLFRDSAKINLIFQQPNSKIFYQLEGNNPNQKLLFKAPLVIDKSTRMRFWAEHDEYLPSNVQEIGLVKVQTDLNDCQITLHPAPHAHYAGKGAETLKDLSKGSINFRKDAAWLGFQNEIVVVKINFPGPTRVSNVKLGVLTDHNSWIFAPRSVQVLANEKVIGNSSMPEPTERAKPSSAFIEMDVEKGMYKELSIEIKALKAIPDWHEGKGTPPWIFIDEILIAP